MHAGWALLIHAGEGLLVHERCGLFVDAPWRLLVHEGWESYARGREVYRCRLCRDLILAPFPTAVLQAYDFLIAISEPVCRPEVSLGGSECGSPCNVVLSVIEIMVNLSGKRFMRNRNLTTGVIYV